MSDRDALVGFGTEERALASEQRFRALIENSLDAIALVSPEGRLLYGSPSIARMLGYPVESLLGRLAFELVHPDDLPEKFALAAHLLAAPGNHTHQVVRFRHQNGEWRWLEVQETNLLHDPAVGALVANFRDVGERKHAEEERARLERQFQESQRLEGLGVLAGGIAHGFNNLLTAILGSASLIDMGLPSPSPLRAHVQQIEQASERAAELCQQMLAYAGKGLFFVRPADLSAVVQDTATLLRVSLPRKTTLEFRLAPGLAPVLADLTPLRQVLVNLILNAAEAIGDREGRITLSTRQVFLGPEKAALAGTGAELPDGDCVVLEVRDTGVGMDEATRRRVFEPFFSTKFTGRGLGLAAVLGIVRGHKGVVQVESAPGQGSTFRLIFPAAVAAAHVLVAQPATPGDRRARGTVLVVEDEPAVRALVAGILEEQGLEVVQAADGLEALDGLPHYPPDLCVVLLDLTMPRLGAAEVLRELRQSRPQLPVVLMSGYSEHELGERFAGEKLAGFLQKPFTRAELVEKVRSALITPAAPVPPAESPSLPTLPSAGPATR